MRNSLRLVGLVFLIFYTFYAISCATLQEAHTTYVAESEAMLRSGNVQQLIAHLDMEAMKSSNNKVLYCLQAGYYHLFLHEYSESLRMFQQAENEIRYHEEKAVISASDVASTAASVVSSDLELPYKGEGFEKIMLSTLQALVFLIQGDREAAEVEIRRADLRQKREEESHQRDLERIEREKQKNSSQKEGVSSLESQFGALDAYAARVVNSFQNSFTYCLSALVREVNGSHNDAYIDYKKCYALNPTRSVLMKLASLSKKLGFKEDFESYRNVAREKYQCEIEDSESETADLVFIYFHGQVPQKIQEKFSIPLEGNIMSVAFPFYNTKLFSETESLMQVSVENEVLGQSEVVLDFIPIVTKALKEKVPGMTVRQIARALAKRELNKQAEKKFSYLGKLTANFINTLTERADLRGWYELPLNIQVFIGSVAAGGQKTVKLSRLFGTQNVISEALEKCDFQAGKATLIFAHSLAGMMTLHHTIL